MNDEERVAALTERLGLQAGELQQDLALEALRHGSYVHERSLAPGKETLRSNERLEFLGDAVLGFLIARRVYERFPGAPEGELTRLRASLVREESLAIVARQLGLGELLLLGRGEQRSGGRDSAGRLADSLEAVLGAVLLSCGLPRAQEVLERLLAPLFEQFAALARDPKTELQQLLQSRRRTPQYQVLNISGPDHARSYEVEVRIDGAPLGRGTGKSKKDAEQAAARATLEAPAELENALLDEPVTLAPPDPRWAQLAADEMARLRAAVPGAQLEHVGATAVPMEGRPVIDLILALPDPSQVHRLPDYESCGSGLFRRRNAASFNVHLVTCESAAWRESLAVRDFLRANPDAAERYAAAKRDAVAAGATTVLQYARSKSPATAEILRRSRELSAP